MRILLIGDSILHNDAVRKILSSKNEVKVHQIAHSQIQENIPDIPDTKFDLLFIDLISFTGYPEGYIKKIKEMGFADYTVVLDDKRTSYKGADQCLSIDTSTQELENLVSDYGK